MYNEYITKGDENIDGMAGMTFIPANTIVIVSGGYIFYDNIAICHEGSANRRKHFWGYDRSNPTAEIERQKLAEKVLDYRPTIAAGLSDTPEALKEYGTIEHTMFGPEWVWNIDYIDTLQEATLVELLSAVHLLE